MNLALLGELGPLMTKYHLGPAQLESVLKYGSLTSEEITSDVVLTIGKLLGLHPSALVADEVAAHIRGQHPTHFADWVGTPGNLTWVMNTLTKPPGDVEAVESESDGSTLMVCPLCDGCFEADAHP